MLPFFRKIRWRLAADNQFFKYSRYAIGEILLVVIGILIALQINNWNNQRLSDKQMTSFLIGMIDDLKSDTLQIDTRLKFYNELLEQKKTILQLPSFKEIDTDSYQPIAQGVVILKKDNPSENAEKFYSFLFSDHSKEILEKFGYQVKEN